MLYLKFKALVAELARICTWKCQPSQVLSVLHSTSSQLFARLLGHKKAHHAQKVAAERLPQTVALAALAVVTLHGEGGEKMFGGLFVAADIHAADCEVIERTCKVGSHLECRSV